MKKIFFISFVCSLSINLLSQSPQKGTSMSAAEANRLNGTVQPTYQGGKSYMQWVAEEKAKKQVATKASMPDFAKLDVTKTIVPGPQPKPAVKDIKQGSDDERETIKVKPQVVTATEPVKTATPSENKVAVPAAAKSSSADPDAKPVAPAKQTTISATVPAQNSGNTGPAAEKPATKD